ncbi:hypothetical protein TNCV_211981 [Trichonephila clavipes]|uniref:Uncharacterized protein n=1 Tax=Trichonephila clavipes TaxID=2585209 RepID=A0A8X6SYM4_TRICX|nr:hypothetical protein TNCV_211981 [Trichonephila clavipes]
MVYKIACCLQSTLCHGAIAMKVLSLMHLVLFHLDFYAEIHLSHDDEIWLRNKIPRWLFLALGKISCSSRYAQLTTTVKYFKTDAFYVQTSCDETLAAI